MVCFCFWGGGGSYAYIWGAVGGGGVGERAGCVRWFIVKVHLTIVRKCFFLAVGIGRTEGESDRAKIGDCAGA